MTDQTPTCPTCGIDLRYPTGLHVVDCPATQANQTPSTEDVLRADPWLVRCAECGSKPGNACYGNGDMPKKLTHQSRLDASHRAALVAHDRAVKAEALREAADHWQDSADHNTPADIDPEWLRARANRIEAGDE